MLAPASLQYLPAHIIQDIVGYVLEAPACLGPHAPYRGPLGGMLHWPLLHVSSTWRAATLFLVFARAKCGLQKTISLTYGIANSSISLATPPDWGYNRHVRHITVTVDFRCVADGSLVLELANPSSSYLYFPNAHTLDMKVVLPFGDYSRVVSSKDNFGWLASYLDNILPAVANTSVEIIDNTADDESVHASHMRPLLQYILRARSSVSVSLSREHSINIADMFPRTDSLTTLMCRWDQHSAHMVRLIHACARSLRTLDITYYTFNNMEKLIVDGQNRVITYPSLSRLYLLGQVDEQKRYFPPLMHAAPFPALVELHINMDYPFCDDLPFRGNEHCLRKTHIVLDPSTIRRLASSGFLLNSKRRALRSVVLGHGGEAVSSHTESAVYEGFFCKIVPMLQHLTIIEGTAMSQALLTLVSNRKEPLGLRTLSMFIDMSLTQCISLVQSLPSLERLFCRPLTLDAEFAGMDIQDVARQLRARYRPLGRRLRRILFKNISSDPSWETCACMLILADLCPHLTKITFPDDGNHRAEAVFTKIAESSALAGLKQSIVPPLKITIDRTHEFPIIRVNREVHRDCPALAESGLARSSSYTAQTMDDVTGHNFASAGNM